MRLNIGRGTLAWLLVLILGTSLHAAESLWLTDYETAKAQAAKLQRPMIVFLTGSDWCPPCGRLYGEVFQHKQFKQWAVDNAVLLEVDFPKGKVLPPEQVKHNDALKTRFKIGGFPTVVVLDHDGTELGRIRYEGGGPKAWLTKFVDLYQATRKP